MRPFNQRITHRGLRFPVRALTPPQPQAPAPQPKAPAPQPPSKAPPQAATILGVNVAAELARFRPFQTYASMPIGLRHRVVEVARKLHLAQRTQKDARTMSEDVFELMAIVDHLAWCVNENERHAQGKIFAVTK